MKGPGQANMKRQIHQWLVGVKGDGTVEKHLFSQAHTKYIQVTIDEKD